MLRQRFSTWAFCLTLLIVCLVTQVVSVSRKSHLRKLKESRILAVRGQILTKLGLTSPPIDKAPWKTSNEDLEAYRAAVEESGKQHGQELECARYVDNSNYFAKRVVRLPLKTRLGRTIQYTDASTSKNPWMVDVNTLRFSTEQLSGQSHIERAELRFNPKFFSTTSLSGSIVEICLNNQPKPSQNSNETLLKECFQVLDSSFTPLKENTLVTYEITGVVKEWVFVPESNGGSINIALKRQATKKESKDKATRGPEPHVLVWYVPRDRYQIEQRHRNRRALDSTFCKKRPKEKRCCLRPLYINFQRDLRWNWIHAPVGFYANYCKGKCPFLWSMDNQTHHTSIMALFKSFNPDAPTEPCCVARAYKPLVILYYEKAKPKIEELSNMAVTACTCL